jgi:SulP family sulfate permease
VEATTT